MLEVIMDVLEIIIKMNLWDFIFNLQIEYKERQLWIV